MIKLAFGLTPLSKGASQASPSIFACKINNVLTWAPHRSSFEASPGYHPWMMLVSIELAVMHLGAHYSKRPCISLR